MEPGNISRLPPPRARSDRASVRSGREFHVEHAAEDIARAPAPEIAPALAPLLSVQAAAPHAAGTQNDEETRRGTCAQQAGMQALGHLQLALLRSDDLPAGTLDSLAAIAVALEAERGDTAVIGRAVALRIRVELARRDAMREI